MGLDLDRWIEKVKACDYLLEDELKALCETVSEHKKKLDGDARLIRYSLCTCVRGPGTRSGKKSELQFLVGWCGWTRVHPVH